MSTSQPLPVSTAPPNDSIWRDINENDFRERINELFGKNEFPGDPKVHAHQDWRDRSASATSSQKSNECLPLDVEERIANDIAFVAAAKNDAKAVSAVALEEPNTSHSLIVRLAANGAIEASVIDALKCVFDLLERCAIQRLHREQCRDRIFDHVISLNRDRMHSRLQSGHSKPPKKYRKKMYQPGSYSQSNNETKAPQWKPLSQELEGLSRYAKSKENSKTLKRDLAALALLYRRVDSCVRQTDEELDLLKRVARESCDFCTPNGRPIEQTIAFYGFKGSRILENKHVRQVNKLGRYWSLCGDLADASRKYARVFKSISLQSVRGFQKVDWQMSNKSFTTPCFVHAEIQLLIHYAIHPVSGNLAPRVLGVSKAACYLCNLFIFNYRQFFITKTHGKLYSFWTVPDLLEYDEDQRLKIRRVLTIIDRNIKISLAQKRTKRPLPTESFVQLRAHFLSSPIPSDLGTLPSNVSNASEPASSSVANFPVIPPSLMQYNEVPFDQLSEQTAQYGIRLPWSSPTPHIERPAIYPSSRSSVVETVSLQPSNTWEDQNGHKRERASSSIASWELPTQRIIRTTSPLQATTNDIPITFEIDGPTQGSVTISQIESGTKPESGVAIDVKAMKPGETMLFDKSDRMDELVLILHNSTTNSLQIALEWLLPTT